ncbi:hypothetical protein NOSIN_00040 [Nocardiopsis sinuspersici]|uniref:Uncharacterized protein n=1 Tax=Nocardiopsis sinuspersici TaxID=501010 RepID=A0A1V3BVZ0_9ACTN|nr:hypothetical protein NOSIN_00040 [Nocardiopsis sinuspersici]
MALWACEAGDSATLEHLAWMQEKAGGRDGAESGQSGDGLLRGQRPGAIEGVADRGTTQSGAGAQLTLVQPCSQAGGLQALAQLLACLRLLHTVSRPTFA